MGAIGGVAGPEPVIDPLGGVQVGQGGWPKDVVADRPMPPLDLTLGLEVGRLPMVDSDPEPDQPEREAGQPTGSGGAPQRPIVGEDRPGHAVALETRGHLLLHARALLVGSGDEG